MKTWFFVGIKMSFELTQDALNDITENVQERFPYLYIDSDKVSNDPSTNYLKTYIFVSLDKDLSSIYTIDLQYKPRIVIDTDIIENPSIERITEIITKLIFYEKKLTHIHTLAARDRTQQAILDLYTLISSLPGSREYDEAESRFNNLKN